MSRSVNNLPTGIEYKLDRRSFLVHGLINEDGELKTFSKSFSITRYGSDHAALAAAMAFRAKGKPGIKHRRLYTSRT